MKIVFHHDHTAIHTSKKNEKEIVKAIKTISALKNYSLTWHQNKFIIKRVLNEYQVRKIIKLFKNAKAVKKDRKIITGFKGCLITGFQLKWL